MTEQEAFNEVIDTHGLDAVQAELVWEAALEWAKHGQEPVGWISYDERFMPYKDRVEAPIEIVEQFHLPVYDHPDPPSRLSKDECRDIFLAKGFTIKEGEKDLKPYVFEAANAMMDAMLSKSPQHPAQPAQPAGAQGEAVDLRELFERLLFGTYAGKDSYYNNEQIKHGCFERAQELVDVAKQMNIALYTHPAPPTDSSELVDAAKKALEALTLRLCGESVFKIELDAVEILKNALAKWEGKQ